MTGTEGLGIRRSARDAMIAHARAQAPLECCGLLIGSAGAIEAAVPARNLRASDTAFLVDPADHFAAIRRARADGRAVVGAYHSHPRSPAIPSPSDVEQALDPAMIHVIVSLAEPDAPDLRAYRIDGRAIVAAPLADIG